LGRNGGRIRHGLQTAEDWTFPSIFCFGGPGRTDILQCDAAAMISPAMFRDLELPQIRQHCRAMDHTMFHLDGIECVDKLDDLLAIEELDAIEWSPDPKSGDSADPRWHELYRRFLRAGKSLQIINLKIEHLAPLLDATGTDGVYLLVEFDTTETAEELARIIAHYRRS
jgi:hypothetical protein